jgi:hypothetical protein
VAQVVQHIPSKLEALSTNPSTKNRSSDECNGFRFCGKLEFELRALSL